MLLQVFLFILLLIEMIQLNFLSAELLPLKWKPSSRSNIELTATAKIVIPDAEPRAGQFYVIKPTRATSVVKKKNRRLKQRKREIIRKVIVMGSMKRKIAGNPIKRALPYNNPHPNESMLSRVKISKAASKQTIPTKVKMANNKPSPNVGKNNGGNNFNNVANGNDNTAYTQDNDPSSDSDEDDSDEDDDEDLSPTDSTEDEPADTSDSAAPTDTPEAADAPADPMSNKNEAPAPDADYSYDDSDDSDDSDDLSPTDNSVADRKTQISGNVIKKLINIKSVKREMNPVLPKVNVVADSNESSENETDYAKLLKLEQDIDSIVGDLRTGNK